MNEFLIDIGFLDREPEAELPRKEISARRSEIQDDKYRDKKDWDEIPTYRRFVNQNSITPIPFKHYEQQNRF